MPFPHPIGGDPLSARLPLGGRHCTPLDEHDGISVGDRITFRDAGQRSQVTGVVAELYLERHPNVIIREPEGSVFAEVVLVDGADARCWFRRDKPSRAREIDGSVGAAPEGAMF